MPDSGQVPLERTEFQVRWNRRSYRSQVLLLVPIFLLYAGLTVFGSGTWRVLGIAGVVVFGLALVAGVAGARKMRRTPVAATLTESGVTVGDHAPVSWGSIREVRLAPVKPQLLFLVRPLHYLAFVPERVSDLPRPKLRERLAIKIYGTNLLLMTQTVTPSADAILAAVQQLSDVPVRR
jgi:hypothetical protein